MTSADKLKWAGERRAVTRAQNSIEVLSRFLDRKGEPPAVREAATIELHRLQKSLTDVSKLRAIYGRKS